jgi:acyl carrier protein|tara:strand:+ start:446 stop:628 length:183 start_codon:yes stop_codon:yes gene_type:complete
MNKNNKLVKNILRIFKIVFSINKDIIINKLNNKKINNSDSLRHLSLIFAIEEEFSIKFID